MQGEKLTLSQLEQYLSKAAWILKGPVDASDFKVYIFPLLFFKRVSDVYDEEYQTALAESDGDTEYASLPEMHRFEIPEGCHWRDVRETTTNVGQAIEHALRGIEKANQEFLYGIFGDAQWSNKNKLSDSLLINLIEHFSQHTLGRENANPDILGNAYEYLIKHFADLTNKKAGEFYTPRSVVHLLGLILDPHEGETIYDPACGTGGMLLECVDHLKHNNEDYRTLKLYGQEKNLTSSSIARMNMFLHGEDNHKIEWGDTIRNPKLLDKNGDLMLFDIVTANPPFSLDKWGHDEAEHDKFSRFRRGVPPKTKGDYAFILHMIETLKPKSGRMGVVVPHGVLFRGSSEGKIRQQLIEENLLDAVIGLPEKLFYGTGIPAAILIFKKEKSDDNVMFIDASHDFKAGKNQNLLTEENIAKIVETYRSGGDVDKYAYVASLDEIKENDYNLNIPRYVDTFEEEEEIDLMAVRAEREQLKAQLNELETEMAKYLEELGYGA